MYAWVVRPDRVGYYHDDGIYVSTAKALATGQGYRIISLPNEPAQTKYPPLLSFLLSLIWRVYPTFPENLLPMMLLVAAAAVGFLALTWRYLVNQRYATHWQAMIIIALTAFNWRAMVSATGIYSEMVFAALSLLCLIAAEHYLEEKERWPMGLLVGVAAGLAILTRTAGVSLLMALAGYCLLRKMWRGLLPVLIGGLFALGWAAWSYFNADNGVWVNSTYYTSYVRDLISVVEDLKAGGGGSTIGVVLGILGRNLLMLVVVTPPVLCLGIEYSQAQYFGFTIMFIVAGFIRQAKTGFRLLHAYVVCYLALHLFWLPYVSYDRFLVPILPFLLLFLVTEVEWLATLIAKEVRSGCQIVRRLSAAVIGLALIASVGIAVYNYGVGVYWQCAIASIRKVAKPPREDAAAIEWIKANTNPEDVVLSYRDPTLYLHTGHKATRSFALKAGVTWQRHQSLIFDIIEESDARYLVVTASDFENNLQPELQRQSFKVLIEQHRERFVPVFGSEDGLSFIYRIIPDKERYRLASLTLRRTCVIKSGAKLKFEL
jgi:hypothetical protein